MHMVIRWRLTGIVDGADNKIKSWQRTYTSGYKLQMSETSTDTFANQAANWILFKTLQ